VKLTPFRLIAIIAIEIVILLAAWSVFSQEKVVYGPQVVLKVDHTLQGEKYAVPQATVYFRLAPVSGPTVNTPLDRGDTMICHMFDLRDSAGMHVAFKCGEDVYLVHALGLSGLKDK